MSPIEKVFVLRHGESEEDVDQEIKWTKKNAEIELTPAGVEDVKKSLENIRPELDKYKKITIITSPFTRTKQTAQIVKDGLPDKEVEVVEEESLRSLNWGNISIDNQKQFEFERYKAGVLRYHFPGGDRSPEYVRNIYDFVYKLIKEKHLNNGPEECIIIVGHGFSIRVVAKAFTDMTDEDFKWIKNPPNNFIVRIYFDPEHNDFYTKEPLPRSEKQNA